MLALRARLIGVVLLGVSAASAWFFGLRPLHAAQGGAEELSVPVKLFLFAPMSLVAGVFLIVGGRAVGEAFSGPPVGRTQHLIVWSMFGIALVLGAASYLWLTARLDALGYS
jgi:hypothetical protein